MGIGLSQILGVALGIAAVAAVVLWIALGRARGQVDELHAGSERASARLADEQAQRAQAQQEIERARAILKAQVAAHSQQSATDQQKIVATRNAFNQLKAKAEAIIRNLQGQAGHLSAQNAALAKWQSVVDAEAKAAELLAQAADEARRLADEAAVQVEAAQTAIDSLLSEGRRRAEQERGDAQVQLKRLLDEQSERRRQGTVELETELAEARTQVAATRATASAIIARAEESARAIAGEAWDAKLDVDRLRSLSEALQNQIDGYGTRYIKPIRSVLDDLGVEVGHTDAGKGLKEARAASRALMQSGKAADCDYVENYRRETACAFILDAFNGKVETILARTKADNAGTLEKQLRDTQLLLNHLGEAFRNVRIVPEYLEARLSELRWAALAQHAKDEQREEQRRIKEVMRDEARAQREYDKALKDAARKEEAEARERRLIEEARERALTDARARQAEEMDAMKNAGEAVRAELLARHAAAQAEKMAEFEEQVAAKDREIREIQESRQRALSMAQQTKAGTVYIISNIGSFGEGVFKVGMTRRLNHEERIDELGDASVPFAFDIHAVMKTSDAPDLESKLHMRLVEYQVNKVNWRKEFFRLDIARLREIVATENGDAEWTLEAEAAEYRQTLGLEADFARSPAAKEAWVREQLGLEHSSPALAGLGTDEEDAD